MVSLFFMVCVCERDVGSQGEGEMDHPHYLMMCTLVLKSRTIVMQMRWYVTD